MSLVVSGPYQVTFDNAFYLPNLSKIQVATVNSYRLKIGFLYNVQLNSSQLSIRVEIEAHLEKWNITMKTNKLQNVVELEMTNARFCFMHQLNYIDLPTFFHRILFILIDLVTLPSTSQCSSVMVPLIVMLTLCCYASLCCGLSRSYSGCQCLILGKTHARLHHSALLYLFQMYL